MPVKQPRAPRANYVSKSSRPMTLQELEGDPDFNPKGKPRLGWSVLSTLALAVESHGMRLGVLCQQNMDAFGEWTVLAFETPGKDLQSVLNSHAHKTVGTYRGLAVAMQEAERYAKKWQRSRNKMRTPCECEEVG
jgi:hypothetical protein